MKIKQVRSQLRVWRQRRTPPSWAVEHARDCVFPSGCDCGGRKPVRSFNPFDRDHR